MAATGRYNFEIAQAATFRLQMTWAVDEVPVDLTGASALMIINRVVKQPSPPFETLEAVVEWTDGAEITLGDAEGTITFEVSDTDTAALSWDEGVYDLFITLAGGDVVRLLKGHIGLDPRLTDPS
jgi:hypothetical protein